MEPKKQNLRAPGYQFSGISSGIKEKNQPDLALIYSQVPAKAVACFTTNRVKSPSVLQGQEAIKNGRLQAVVINSGNANAVTGAAGLKHAHQMARKVSEELQLAPQEVLVSSTGKIGVPLPIQKILKKIPQAVTQLSPAGLSKAAEAIRTTDRFPKTHQTKIKLRGKTVTVTGVAKGAGMIEPNMATMLAYVLTDFALPLPLMRREFRAAVEASFNAITVDGDQSTNDTALLMANGVSGISIPSQRSPGFAKFRAALQEVCQNLALKMVQDGEGATKVVEIHIKGAKSQAAAKKIAYTVARSQLVKTAFFGEDPNWGRILCAVGYSGETFDPQRVDIAYGAVPLLRRGVPLPVAQEQKAHKVLKKQRFTVTVHLHAGSGEARVFTSDLGYEYVRINSEYRT